MFSKLLGPVGKKKALLNTERHSTENQQNPPEKKFKFTRTHEIGYHFFIGSINSIIKLN